MPAYACKRRRVALNRGGHLSRAGSSAPGGGPLDGEFGQSAAERGCRRVALVDWELACDAVGGLLLAERVAGRGLGGGVCGGGVVAHVPGLAVGAVLARGLQPGGVVPAEPGQRSHTEPPRGERHRRPQHSNAECKYGPQWLTARTSLASLRHLTCSVRHLERMSQTKLDVDTDPL